MERQVGKHSPVLVGVGQVVRQWEPGQSQDAPSPLGLMVEAVRAALKDSAVDEKLARAIDTVFVVRSIEDSVPDSPYPFGRAANPPGSLAEALDLQSTRHVYSVVGGDQPQALVSEAAEDICSGRARAVLIAGAEATGAMKRALKAGLTQNWASSSDLSFEDRGLGPPLLSEYERMNGLGAPTQTYPAFEHALRARLGYDQQSYVDLMSELWEGFARIAEQNPYAQFRDGRSRAFLATPTRDNYKVASPYLKWHVAQDAANQGAAVVMTSVGEAEAIGIDPSKWIYLHGYSAVCDTLVTERPDLSRSQAIDLALSAALERAGKSAAEIDLADLYSCFPCAVLLAVEAMQLDWRRNTPTITGGLPFFGGPGNNYSLHAIATLVERLRAQPRQFGLILANGGFLSKQAAGVYSAIPKPVWRPVSSDHLQAQIDARRAPQVLNEATEATVETFTVTYKRGAPSRGYVIARNEEGRILARVRTGHRATLAALARHDPIGTNVRITHENGVNYLEPGRLGDQESKSALFRQFDGVLVHRTGHLLEVTLDRPDSMNALHSSSHFALHEICDSFEADPSLWLAILTGTGTRAFCSGNDLKVSAKGGDMAMPPSGFAGLCARYDRTKPIIAAVNGVAMGGGMEIVLACDFAVADESARFALPEVKVGLFAAAGGVQRLIREIGRKRAMDLILTGRAISAAEAAALGLVNAVVPDGTCLERARALAETIASNSPTAIRASLEAINGLDTAATFEEAVGGSAGIIAKLLRNKDFKEGVTAFAEKRAPKWTGS